MRTSRTVTLATRVPPITQPTSAAIPATASNAPTTNFVWIAGRGPHARNPIRTKHRLQTLCAAIALTISVPALADEIVARRLRALDQAFAKADKTDDLAGFHTAQDKTEALIAELRKAPGAMPPPLRPCYRAAAYLSSSRGLSWITARSASATDADRRIDAANRADFLEALRACAQD